MLKTCPICRHKFEAEHFNEKYCSPSCKREGRIQCERELYRYKTKHKNGSKSLVEKNAQARKMGLTYGQLQAMKYAQEHRLEV